ncbi:phage replisome organizer N-terminal domain-containing protein [Clostridium intestinale]|uniref:Phage replisome organizer N-terminal domain-containing protein n=1 Tax=Clostridium intestinale TaxID=36845 RepID=A0A7D6VQU2_9CLOT|nr:phage replisome organizer N-terminal domain-containing protein [Clostridium intestinale]QLY79966.1 phage replisome organizer N-terminal domain-containing protein [Clostridium intestinale]
MKERKYVKLRVDMYEDTKFKIIDMKPERDVIYYIWNRILLLAGKVNLEGELYLSKSIPYTMETFSIEFNRDIAQIKLALDIFIELEMLELTEDNVYKVKNFAKHQNIKVKEKEISKNKESEVKDNPALSENINPEILDKKDKKLEDKVRENRSAISEDVPGLNLEIINESKATAVKDSIDSNIKGNGVSKDTHLLFDTMKSKNKTRKKKDAVIDIIDTDEGFIDEDISNFSDVYIPLDKDDSMVSKWSFG